MSKVCSQCGSVDIDVDPTRGDTVCMTCGSVLEEQQIVSEVQFQESAIGASSVIGQFVGNDGTKEHSLGSSFQHGFGKESKAETLQKAKRRFQNLGAILKLNQHCIDTAVNFFKMAYLKKLTRTRKSSHVVAACVYLVCRTEGLPHMLLDISDAVQVNVYTLGKTYLILSRYLSINIPATDPCLYIPRFAHRLEFGDKTHEVSMAALRLVQRMKRDWMSTGRRPSGLCGAALLVAARLHDFSRSTKEIIKVVKVCENTIKKRLYEFGATASSKLTIDEFQRIDLETEHDPPAYTEGKKKSKIGQLDDANKLTELTAEVNSLQREIESSLHQVHKNNKTSALVSKLLPEDVINDEAKEEIQRLENDELSNMLSGGGDTLFQGPRPSATSLGIQESVVECLQSESENQNVENDDGELDLAGLDDEELDKFILSKEESRVKTIIWMNENADYLKKLNEKQLRESKEEETASKTRRKRTRRPNKPIQAKSATEAIEQMLHQKKISNKINYEVLKDLNKTVTNTPPVDEGPILSNVEDEPISRFKKPSPLTRSPCTHKLKSDKLSLKNVSFNPNLQNSSPMKKPKLLENLESSSSMMAPVVIESGPVDYATQDGNEDDVEDDLDDEEDEPVGAAHLFGHSNYEDYDEDVMDDDIDD